jgi:hypothetical protein
MNVKRWMIAATAIAVLLAAGRYLERRTYYLGQASVNAGMRALYTIGGNGKLDYFSDRHPFVFMNADMFKNDDTLKPEYVKDVNKLHAYFDGLVRKYRHAASHPWLYVEPDPPPPKSMPGIPLLRPPAPPW